METLGDRVAKARGDEISQAELARRIGVKAQAVQNLESRRADRTKYLLEIARALDVRPEWLQWGDGPMKAEHRSEHSSAVKKRDGRVTIDGDDYALLPAYDARAAAGAGAVGEDDVLYRLAFRTQWLMGVTQSPLDKLGLLEIDNDSMEPTLRSGDQALVDTLQRNPQSKDGIYVLRGDAGLQAKRVSSHPVTGMLTIISDNQAYETWRDIDPATIDILGRVIWIGRRV